MSSNPLAGKVAVICGGSGGIGAASARLLAEAGATVVVGYHGNRAKAEAVAAELAGTGPPGPGGADDRQRGPRPARAEVAGDSAGPTSWSTPPA